LQDPPSKLPLAQGTWWDTRQRALSQHGALFCMCPPLCQHLAWATYVEGAAPSSRDARLSRLLWWLSPPQGTHSCCNCCPHPKGRPPSRKLLWKSPSPRNDPPVEESTLSSKGPPLEKAPTFGESLSSRKGPF